MTHPRSSDAALFQSKRDAWLTVVLSAGSGVLFIAALVLIRSGPSWPSWVVAIGFLTASALLLWVLFGTSYAVSTTDLRVRCGPFRWRVPLAAVDEVVPTHESAGVPALSLDRLRVV